MSIELSTVKLSSGDTTEDYSAPFKWSIELNVLGQLEKAEKVVEISFILCCDPESNDADYEMESIEVECDALKPGRNAMQIEHEAPDFAKYLGSHFFSTDTLFVMQVVLKYGPDEDEKARQPFMIVGIPVLLSLKPSIKLEEVEVILDTMVQRHVMMKRGKKNPIQINWSDAPQENENHTEEPDLKKSRVEVITSDHKDEPTANIQ